jgi:hypothetical protein
MSPNIPERNPYVNCRPCAAVMFPTLCNTHSPNFVFIFNVQHITINKIYKEKETLRFMSVFIKLRALKLFHNMQVSNSTLKSLRFLSLTMQSTNLHQPNLFVPQINKVPYKCHLSRLQSVCSLQNASKSLNKMMFRRRYITAHIKVKVIPLKARCGPEGG